jgi:predicted GIY-YIG superfamily endonuclease
MTPKQNHVYYLVDPRNNEVKYVGKTKNPKSRYKQHITKLDKTMTPKKQWLMELFAKGLQPKMIIAETVNGEGRIEEQAHLDKHKSTALNIHNPGKGVASRSRDEIQW